MTFALTLTAEEISRFWSYVAKTADDACWPWLGGKNRSYGIFTAGRSFRAHRLAFMLGTGIAVLPGVVVRHECNNPPCCNYAHLALGSDVDNNADRDRLKRAARGKRNGAAKLSNDAVIEIRARSRAGESASRVLGPEFGISCRAVRYIRDGATWGWLVEEDDTDERLERLDPEAVIAEMRSFA